MTFNTDETLLRRLMRFVAHLTNDVDSEAYAAVCAAGNEIWSSMQRFDGRPHFIDEGIPD